MGCAGKQLVAFDRLVCLGGVIDSGQGHPWCVAVKLRPRW